MQHRHAASHVYYHKHCVGARASAFKSELTANQGPRAQVCCGCRQPTKAVCSRAEEHNAASARATNKVRTSYKHTPHCSDTPSRRTASSLNAHAHQGCQPPGPSATPPSRAVAEGPMPRDPGPQQTSRCSLAGQRAVCRVACISQGACAWHAHAARAGLESQPKP